jgi:nucleoside-diphosphate-sugar epimerase
MGSATLQELLGRRDRFDIVLLVLDTKAERKKLARLKNEPGIKIVWGDLRDYKKVLECVTGADYILHTAALISPEADLDPERTRSINVGSIENILKAIKAQPEPNAAHLVTIGSVAMTGSRLPPIHWGKVGDPLAPAINDHYAVSKIEAERLVVESGLRHWVSLRQTFICIPEPFSLLHPIMFHQPLNTQFEFITARDAGLMMANACGPEVPKDFWRRVYNIGGGEACRVNYVEYLNRIFGALGLGTIQQLAKRNWFALQNFHCQWYLDSDELEKYLHFQRDGLEEYVAQVLEASPWYLKLGLQKMMPKILIRNLVMKRLALEPQGPLGWIQDENQELIKAFFGSKKRWEEIPLWDEAIPAPGNPQPLEQGFDYSLSNAQIGLGEAQSAAVFRGGKLLATSVITGELWEPVSWECALGHQFSASMYLILRAGHWCPDCAAPPWNYAALAIQNRFLAQVL